MPTIFIFFAWLEMIAKFQRGTLSHSNTSFSFLQCAANGLALCSRKGRTIIKVMWVGRGGGGGVKARSKKIYIMRGKI